MVRRVESGMAEPSRRERWRGLIAEWSASGQTQVAFCRGRGLNAGTFAWWKRQLRQRSAGDASKRSERLPKSSSRFVEVRWASVAPAYEIVLAGGRSIRVPERFEPQALSRLITAVESC